MTDLLTIGEVAAELRISKSTVRNIIRAGDLQVVEAGLSAKSDRIERNELDRYKVSKRRNRKLDAVKGVGTIHIPRRDVSAELDRLLAAKR